MIQAPNMHLRVADAIRRGKMVCQRTEQDLFTVDYYDLAHRPVSDVGQLLGVPAKSGSAIDGGSVGVFDLAGMSESQRRFAAQLPEGTG